MRDGAGDETEDAEAVHADLAVGAAAQNVRARAVGEEGEGGGFAAGRKEGGGGGVGHHGESVDIGRVHVGGLHVAVYEKDAFSGGGGELGGGEETVGVTAAGEQEVERRRAGGQAERVVQADGEGGKAVGHGE